jgi:hypothetical protein
MLAQAQECVWQWAVMGAVTIRISIGLPLAPNPRSQLKRDDSETSCTGRSHCLLRFPVFTVFRRRSCMILHDWQFVMQFRLSGTRYRP